MKWEVERYFNLRNESNKRCKSSVSCAYTHFIHNIIALRFWCKPPNEPKTTTGIKFEITCYYKMSIKEFLMHICIILSKAVYLIYVYCKHIYIFTLIHHIRACIQVCVGLILNSNAPLTKNKYSAKLRECPECLQDNL